jgi:regulator of RNase E activity RraA
VQNINISKTRIKAGIGMPETLEGTELLGVIPKERIVKVKIERPAKKVIAELLKLEDLTPTVSDVLDMLGMPGAIPASVLKPLLQGRRVAGPAITLRNIPDRTTPYRGFTTGDFPRMGAERECYNIGEPGDIVVIDGGGRTDRSNMGGLSATIAHTKGIGANIIDGGARDGDTIRKVGYPVWARSESPISSKFRHEAIEINGPVTCAGVQVRPGDLVVADDSGVAFVPLELVEEVAERAKDLTTIEEKMRTAILKRAPNQDIMKLYWDRYKEH